MAILNMRELREIVNVMDQLDAVMAEQIGIDATVTDVNGDVLGYIVGVDGEYLFNTTKEEI